MLEKCVIVKFVNSICLTPFSVKEFIQGGKVTLQMSEDKHSRKSVHDETIM